jgi:O-antigen ligase
MRDAPELTDVERSIYTSIVEDSGVQQKSMRRCEPLHGLGSSSTTRSHTETALEATFNPISASPAGRFWLIDIAGFLFAVSIHKYAVRNSLSSSIGVQGIIEFLCITGALLCVFVATWGRRRQHPPSMTSICFVIFGLFALGSSWRSFYPALSIVKGMLLLVVLATGYLASQASLGQRYIQAIYRSYALLLLVGLIMGIVFPHIYPLFSIDEYSGRTTMSVFDTFSGVVGEDAALMLLLALLLNKKPSWIVCIFLLIVNVLAGGKTSTALLCVLLCIRGVSGIRGWRSWGAVLFVLGTACIGAIGVVSLLRPGSTSQLFARSAESIYGTQVGTEAHGLDGRLDLWKGTVSLLPTVPFFGYGFGGARDLLLKIAIWSGSCHDSYLEMALTGGLLGFSFFALGICIVIGVCLRAPPAVRLSLLSVLAFILILAIIGEIFDEPSFAGFLILLWLPYVAAESSVTALRAAPRLPWENRAVDLEVNTTI